MSEFNFRVPAELEQAAMRLEATGDYKVLRRLPRVDEIWVALPADNPVRIAVLDCETTGLNADIHQMVELAITVISVNADGRLHEIQETRSWREQPRESLSEEIKRITGLTDSDLEGEAFDEAAIAAILRDCDILCSHNARFDRAFLARRFPALVDRPWGCSLNDIGWARAGFNSRQLQHLLAEAGYFYVAHQAAPDSLALACLLVLKAQDGRIHAAHLIDAVRTPTLRLFASRAPFEIKDQLKAKGYRWCPERRVWWTDVGLSDAEAEREWLVSLSPQIMPVTSRITAFERHL